MGECPHRGPYCSSQGILVLAGIVIFFAFQFEGSKLARLTHSSETNFSDTITCADVSRAGDTLSSSHAISCDVNACICDARGDLTLNSMVQIHTSVTAFVTWSRVELWSAHVPSRLSNFCCRTHFVRRDVRVERSSHVTSCSQKWRKCLLKKCANITFYMTPSHQTIEISIWEPKYGKG
jgi:hypothetical protein